MGYINKEDTIGKLLFMQEKLKGQGPYTNRVWFDKCINCITTQEEADVAPIVRAKWVESEEFPRYMQCSNCGNCFIPREFASEYKWHFCPQCGARIKDNEE